MAYARGRHRVEVPTWLSLWEIAHRWEGENPLTETVQSVAVLDRLRWLLGVLAEDKLHQLGDKVTNQKQHDILFQLKRTLEAGKVPTKQLKQVRELFINVDYVCHSEGVALPAFWFEPVEDKQIEQAAPTSPKSSARKKTHNGAIKEKVQALAIELISTNPALRQIEVYEHPQIQALLDAQCLKKNVQRWIREADPRPKESIPKGRRKKAQQ